MRKLSTIVPVFLVIVGAGLLLIIVLKSVDVRLEDSSADGKPKTEKHVADAAGQVAIARKDIWGEDYIRGEVKVRSTYNLLWAHVSATAKGYQPGEWICLHEMKFEDRGPEDDGFQRLEFSIALKPMK